MPALPRKSQTSWTNWAGNQTCSPTKIERPLTEAQLVTIVKQAAKTGKRVRPVGSGHSFTAIVCTDDIIVSLEHLNQVKAIDTEAGLVTVQAGISLDHLNQRLAQSGLAMTNLGDIAYQSLAGAISTGTHGTGARFGGLATQIRGMRIVTATGDVVSATPDEEPELFHTARVGLGALGIIAELTLAVEPAFRIHAVEGPQPLSEVLGQWPTSIATHDHYEFFYIPGTDMAMTKANQRTIEAPNPQPKVKHVVDKILGENVGFGAMTMLARRRPALIPKLRSIIVSQVGQAEFIDESYKVFASPRWVRFVEMEYSVAVDDVPVILSRIDQAVAEAGIELLFPIEVRAAAADDIPLSTAHGRPTGYIAVHRSKGHDYRPYFELVEAIMDEYNGRPHWGKMHFQTASNLAPRYPQWHRFQAVRDELDPNRIFANPYLDRVLG
jgi:L-gulonolactone oxidase